MKNKVLVSIFTGLIRGYQWFLSPLKRLFFGESMRCRFYPTCSHYGIESFKKHGVFGGMYLTTLRILRCHPFCEGGIDEVPERIRWK